MTTTNPWLGSTARLSLLLSAVSIAACGRTALLEDDPYVSSSTDADAGGRGPAPDGSPGAPGNGSNPPSGGHITNSDGGIDVATACVGIDHNVLVVTRDDGSRPVILEGGTGWRDQAADTQGWRLAAYPPNALPTDLSANISSWQTSFSTYSLRTPLEPGRTYSDTHGLETYEYSEPNAGFEVVEGGSICKERGRFQVIDLTMESAGSRTRLASFTIVFEYSCGEGERFNRGCVHMMR